MKSSSVVLLMVCVANAAVLGQDLSRAVRLFESQQWVPCVAELEPLARSHPDNGDVQRLLGHAYAELGRDDEARRALGLAIAHGRATDAVLIRLARLTQKDDPITALEALRRAWMQAPKSDVGLTLVDLAVELGRVEEAEAMTRVLWERGERPVEVLRRAAVLHERAGRLAEAATALETALLLTTPTPEAMEAVAALHERRGDPERAASWLSKASALLAGDAKEALMIRQARLLLAAHRDADATAVASAVRGAVHRGAAAFLLGHLAARAADLNKARAQWRLAAEAGYRDAAMERFLADADYQDGRPKDAAPRYTVLCKESHDPVLLERWIRCLVASEADPTDVRAALQTYIARVGLDATASALVALAAGSFAGAR